MIENRLICYLDLLGFKNIVMTNPISDVVARLYYVFDTLVRISARHSFRTLRFDSKHKDLLEFIKGEFNEKFGSIKTIDSILDQALGLFQSITGLNVLLMSDSIIIYSQPLLPNSKLFNKNVINIARISRDLIYKLLMGFLPARGALSYGEFYVDSKHNIFCGKALVDACINAENQDWIGILITKSFEKHLLPLMISPIEYADMINKTRNVYQSVVRAGWDVTQYMVPLKTGNKKRYIINWATQLLIPKGEKEMLIESLTGDPIKDKETLHSIKKIKEFPKNPADFFKPLFTGNQEIDKKYLNSINFIKNWEKCAFLETLRSLKIYSWKNH